MVDENVADATEEWRPVVGWEGIYEVSDLGRLKRVKAACRTNAGRLLTDKCFERYIRNVLVCEPEGRRSYASRHVIVAAAFLGPRPEGHFVNHKNGTKTDNRVDNLEYVTAQGNSQHATLTGLISLDLDRTEVRDIRVLAKMVTKKRVSELFDIDPSTVSRIVSGHIYAWA